MTLAQGVFAGLIGIVLIQRITELRLAKRNEAWARSSGARELGAGHYPLFFLLHGGWGIGWITEAALRGPTLSQHWWAWASGFVLAEVLRYWAIATLGRRWNTRILVIDGLPAIRTGPYRFVAHPNYLAVAIELACIPMVFGGWITALIASVLNAALLLGVRIPAEQRAVADASRARG
ncbi:isoprenylcysteine carboxyl methyltransferase family protein [Nannocystaceae bacterium ST9]